MKIYVVSHVEVEWVNKTSSIGVWVGQKEKTPDGWLYHGDGENIASLNNKFCEMTAQYFVWKNVLPSLPEDEMIGFCHYRRTFTSRNIKINKLKKLNDFFYKDQESFYENRSLSPNKVYMVRPEKVGLRILMNIFYRPTVTLKNIFFNGISLYTMYAINHGEEVLELIQQEMETGVEFIEYLKSVSELSCYNMYIVPRKILDNYFERFFKIFLELNHIIDYSTLDKYQTRAIGFLAERYADFYFKKNYSVQYVGCNFMDF